MQEGDEIVDGSETVIYTLQPQASLTVIEKNKTTNATFIGPPPTPKNDAIKPSVKPTAAIHIGFVILKLFAFLIFI